jgi:hypothetical protein
MLVNLFFQYLPLLLTFAMLLLLGWGVVLLARIDRRLAGLTALARERQGESSVPAGR